MFLCHYTVIYAHQNCYREISAVLEVDVKTKINGTKTATYVHNKSARKWNRNSADGVFCPPITRCLSYHLLHHWCCTAVILTLLINWAHQAFVYCFMHTVWFPSCVHYWNPLVHLCSDIGKYVNNCIHNAASCQPVVVWSIFEPIWWAHWCARMDWTKCSLVLTVQLTFLLSAHILS